MAHWSRYLKNVSDSFIAEHAAPIEQRECRIRELRKTQLLDESHLLAYAMNTWSIEEIFEAKDAASTDAERKRATSIEEAIAGVNTTRDKYA